MKKCNYETNTGHRYISEYRKTFNINVRLPDGSYKGMTVSMAERGRFAALSLAIERRDKAYHKAWGKHWQRVLNEPDLFARMPKTLEPKRGIEQKSTGYICEYYLAEWRGADGKKCKLKRSVKKYGAKEAYRLTKNALIRANAEFIDLMILTGRITTKDLCNG